MPFRLTWYKQRKIHRHSYTVVLSPTLPMDATPYCDALEAMQEMINPDSLKVLTECYVERYLAEAKPLDYLQFRRIGYFNVDKESTAEHLVFNRTVSLKDTWSKMNK